MKYGLLGKNLKHSWSKKIHSNLDYDFFEIDENLVDFIEKVKKEQICFNVTFPYKEEILQFLDEKTLSVIKTNACNTVAYEDGKLVGYNTDYLALKEIFKAWNINEMKVLLIGYGGAGKAVFEALKTYTNNITIANRDVTKVKDKTFICFDQINENIHEFDLVINATNAEQNNDRVFNFTKIKNNAIFFDLIYNPEKTNFLTIAEQLGATIHNGYDMLKLQGEIAQAKWRGEKNIAIFGGSFNPPHKIHKKIINYIEINFNFDEVWLMPTNFSPFKNKISNITREQHIELLHVFADLTHAKLKLDDYNDKIAYTDVLLKKLSSDFSEYQFSLVIGGDNIDSFDKWHNYEYLLKYYDIYAFPREGYINNHEEIKIIDLHLPNVSSSLFRESLDKDLLDDEIYHHIKRHGLYGLK